MNIIDATTEAKSARDLQSLLAGIYRAIAPVQERWLKAIVESGVSGTKLCEKCQNYRRQILYDFSACVSAYNEQLSPRYEPCRDCFQWDCYEARIRNSGVPIIQPVTFERDEKTFINWSLDGWAKHKCLWRKDNKRRALHQWLIRFADSRFAAWRDVETMEQAGFKRHKQELGYASNLIVDIDDARGEGFRAFLNERLNSPAANTTWIIGGTDALDPIIPKEFLRV